MREQARRRAAIAGALLVVLAGCGGGTDKAVPGATVPTAPPQTTTTAPYAVPPVIDAAYVTRVIAGLDQITGDATRLVVSSKAIPREVFDRLKAIYADDADVDLVLKGYSSELSQGLPSARPNPGNQKSTVKEVISTSPQCMYARVERDYTAVGVKGATASTEWIALRPLDSTRDPFGYNTTTWAYLYEGFTKQRTQPERNPCLA